MGYLTIYSNMGVRIVGPMEKERLKIKADVFKAMAPNSTRNH